MFCIMTFIKYDVFGPHVGCHVLGWALVILKSDGENAAKELMSELARKRKEAPTVVETSKPYDSKSNGRAEGAVRRLESQVRTLKIAAERNLGVTLDVHSPLFAWLAKHSADF